MSLAQFGRRYFALRSDALGRKTGIPTPRSVRNAPADTDEPMVATIEGMGVAVRLPRSRSKRSRNMSVQEISVS